MDFNVVYVKALHSANGPKTQPGVPLSNQLAVAAHIAMRYVDWASGDGAWPSIATLSNELGMSPKTTGNAIIALERQGWLIVELRRNRPSIYKLAIPKLTQPLLSDVNSTQQPLLSDVTVTQQNLPSDVNSAASDVTVTDDPIVLPIKVAASRESEAALLDDGLAEMGWEQLECEIFDQLSELYRGRAAIETAQRFISTCRAFAHLCPALKSPQGVLTFLADQRSYWASARASEKAYPKTAHDFVAWTAKQSAIEAYAARTATAPKVAPTYEDKETELVRERQAQRDKVRRLSESWLRERSRYYAAITTLWMDEHSPFKSEAHEVYDAMQTLIEETGKTEAELREDPPWKRSWRDDIERAAAKELGIDLWEVMT